MNYKPHAPYCTLPQHQSNNKKGRSIIAIFNGSNFSLNSPPTCHLLPHPPSMNKNTPPLDVPSHAINQTTNRASLLSTSVVSVAIFCWSNISFKLASDLSSSVTLSSTPHTLPSHAINLTTKKSRSIDHSCAEYCDFYLVKYFTETHHQPAIFCHACPP